MARHTIGSTDVDDLIRVLVNAAPPLSLEQREQLAAIFAGAPRITAPIPVRPAPRPLPAAA